MICQKIEKKTLTMNKVGRYFLKKTSLVKLILVFEGALEQLLKVHQDCVDCRAVAVYTKQ